MKNILYSVLFLVSIFSFLFSATEECKYCKKENSFLLKLYIQIKTKITTTQATIKEKINNIPTDVKNRAKKIVATSIIKTEKIISEIIKKIKYLKQKTKNLLENVSDWAHETN